MIRANNLRLYIPEHVKTMEFCLKLITKTGSLIAIPDSCISSPEFNLAAVEANPYVIEYILPAHITREMALIAVRKSALLRRCVPLRLRTPDFIRELNQANKNSRPAAHVKLISKPASSTHIPPHIALVAIQTAVANGDICSITFEPLQQADAVITSCGHIFSSEGLKLAFERKPNVCPMCSTIC